ncbi:MAG: glycine cleavage system protein GcvH [Gammaproteobacteria bacterium]|nr:glycine cleavage system protein GcvH [Gammaproteobacteria bacterium]MCH9743460.1 glycine cleavage system protein GcvH [Gammaproteobacteria bacterium]
MADCPDDLHYTEQHEWVRVEEGDIAAIGITDFAQSQMGDLVFVELPMIADQVVAGNEAGVVESVKTASDIYSPVTGEVVAINEDLSAQPEIVNEDPYHKGWLFKVKLNDASEIDRLLKVTAYQAITAEE